MKRILLIIAIGCMVFSLPIHAQKLQVKPHWPDWLQEMPKPGNSSYRYKIIKGTGPTEPAAKANAVDNLRSSITTEFGQGFTAKQDGVQLHEDYYDIPFDKVCEYSERQDGGWTTYILFWVAKDAIQDPKIDTYYGCNSYKKYEQFVKKKRTSATVASAFIPGMGQMMKKQGGKGAAFLISELALFGGGAACYFLGQDQSKKMKAVGTSYDDYKKAKNMKNTYDIAMYACFGVGVAVHISNIVHAWYVRDNHMPRNLSFVPAIIPINELSQPSYAYGAGVQINF